MIAVQRDFSGGMNLLSNEINIAANQYGRATNVRNRDDGLTIVKGPRRDSTAPTGNKQGIYSYENYVIVFNNGAAYYKNLLLDSGWTKINNFALLPSAEYIYAEVVPGSSFNFARKLKEATRIDGSSTETNVDISSTLIDATSAGLVCQDGVSQGYLIEPDGTARKLKTYAEWSTSNREFVPVMSRMRYHNGILFGVASDGITLLRSVSGRPLDFVVNVTMTGEKGGDEKTTSYAVGVNPITCLASLKTGELFVGTSRTCHPVELNYEKTIFAEPTFLNRKTFLAGITNHFSLLDILTDYAMIDFDGIRSWNAIFSLDNEGRNSLFSRNISRVLEGVTQNSVTAGVVFDNYAIFSINTSYGNRLAVFDILRETWVSFDDLGIGNIKQFAVADRSTSPKLYAITATEVYELYASSNNLSGSVNTAGMTMEDNTTLHPVRTYVTIDGGNSEEDATLSPKVDNTIFPAITQPMRGDSKVDVLCFNTRQHSAQGDKFQAEISWSGSGKLTKVVHEIEAKAGTVGVRQRANLFS